MTPRKKYCELSWCCLKLEDHEGLCTSWAKVHDIFVETLRDAYEEAPRAPAWIEEGPAS
jgi:hypothetical protein